MANVFIGIPTINRPEFVREAIGSVVNQTYSDFEVVVSDNCSDPGVSESIVEYINELGDDRVSFHQQKQNVGEYGQGRFFISKAKKSRYFMILHDDDMLGENYLQKAIECLEAAPECAYFVSDANIVDENGKSSSKVQLAFLKDHGRITAKQGVFSVLDNHLRCGFTLISGALFRTKALLASGFVDPEGVGNYPFESDIFIRLGDIGAKAWYQKQKLLTFRFHSTSMRHYIKLLDNEKTVNAMVNLFATRSYIGYPERRRRQILGRLYRAKALIALRQSESGKARKFILKCFNYNSRSLKLWAIAPLLLIAPTVLTRLLPKLPVTREAPLLRPGNNLE